MPTLAVGVFLATTYFLFDYFSVLRGDIGTMMTALFVRHRHRLLRPPAGQGRAVAATAATGG